MNKYSIEGKKPANKFKHALRIMRITLFFLFFGVLFSQATNSYSQKTSFTLHIKSASIKGICEEIERKSDFRFIFAGNAKKIINKKVDLTVDSQNIEEILDNILSKTELTYSILDNQIVIYRDEERIIPKEVEEIISAEVEQQQKKQITGTIVDENNISIIGANVVEVGTTNGTVTDENGRFTLEVENNSLIRISYMGYLEQIINTSEEKKFEIILHEDTKALDELVVVGYGTMKKSDLTGAVASVDAEDLVKRNTTTIEEGLQGMAAGVQIMRNSGSPSGEVSVRIRGVATINNSADPLYVVDGVMVGTSASFLNPNDVESVEILKDASATAIYGSRGANGVIMITTKKGKSGEVKLNVSGTLGIQTPAEKIDVADAALFATAANKAANNDNTPLNPVWTSPNNLNNIDWQDEMSQTSLRQVYNISATGGSEKIQSLISVGITNNNGIVLESNYKRLTARANVDYKVKKYLRVGMNISYMHSEWSGGGNLLQYASTIPTMDTLDISGNNRLINVPIQYPDGTWGHFPREGNGYNNKGADNPVAVAKTRDALNFTNHLLANANIEVDIVNGFMFKSVLSVNSSSRGGNQYAMQHNRTYLGNPDDDFNINLSNSLEYIMEDYFTYDRIWGKHHPIFLIGYSATKGTSRWLEGNSSKFPTSNIRQLGMTLDPSTKNVEGGLGRENTQQSFFGRINYSYDDRYLLTTSIRRDGSSNFGTGNRYGMFPSFSAAWRLSEENFMQNKKIISNLKFRVGWGRTGNAGNSTNLSVDQLNSSRIAFYHYDGSGFSIAPGLAQTREIDTNLKWETNEQLNIGIDLGLLRNTLSITADYFRRDAVDLLLYRALRPSTGYDNIYTNAGHIRNSGFEFLLNYQKNWRDWNLGVKFNGTFIQNEAVDVGDDIYYENNVADGAWWNSYSITRNGYPVGSYFGWRTDGLWQSQSEIDAANTAAAAAGSSSGTYQNAGTQPGDRKFKDIDGNGWVDDQDREVIGNGYPDFTYGLNLSLGWKNFNLTMYLYGVTGQDILSYAYRNLTTIMDPSGSGLQNILTDYARGAWTEAGSTNVYPRLTKADPAHNGQVSDAYILNGDFLKIQNVQLSYTFPRKLSDRVKMENVRIFCSVENLLTITQYNAGDPEVGNRDPRQTGFDAGRYPFPRTVSLGISFDL